LIGGIIGELCAGTVFDYFMKIQRRKSEGKVIPEARLNGMLLGAIALIPGLIVFGWGMENHKTVSYKVIVLADAIAAFGVQIQITGCYTYLTDAYKAQSTDSALAVNFSHQLFAFTTGFWVVPFGNKIGFRNVGIFWAVMSTVFFIPVVWMRFSGAAWRAKWGMPSWNRGI